MKSLRRGNILFAVYFIVFSLFILLLFTSTNARADLTNYTVPYLACDDATWWAGIDLYNGSTKATSVTILWQDAIGRTIKTLTIEIAAFGHYQLGTGQLKNTMTLRVTADSTLSITAFQGSLDSTGKIMGITALPIVRETALKN
ncbi:MAG: hypothetical protein JW883_00770 [Deltaproteobacteria bacterium]|nr:hypothetical protein [Deltaproteobacteria bacterium]